MLSLKTSLLGNGYTFSTVFPHNFGMKIVHTIHKHITIDRDVVLFLKIDEKYIANPANI